jgi:hypothetical protein
MDGRDLRALFAAGHPPIAIAFCPPGDPGIHAPVPVSVPVLLDHATGGDGRLPREPAAHARLVTALQEHHLADDLAPPHESIRWPADLLAHWFEHGGRLLPHERAAAQFNALGGSNAWRSVGFSLDDVYSSLPARPAWFIPTAGRDPAEHIPLPPSAAPGGSGKLIGGVCIGGSGGGTTGGSGDIGSCGSAASSSSSRDGAGILGSIARGDEAALERVAAALDERGWAAVRLGLCDGIWQNVCAEVPLICSPRHASYFLPAVLNAAWSVRWQLAGRVRRGAFT